MRRLTALLKELKPDVLQTFTLRPNVYGALAGARAGVPVIICTVTGLGTLYTSDDLKTRLARPMVEAVTRQALRHARVVVFQNRDDLSYYLGRGLCRPEQARLIMGSGVDVYGEFNRERFSAEQRRALRARFGLDERSIVLLVARLIRPKGLSEFLEAARRLQDKAQFVLVGEPDPGNPASLTPQDVEALRREGVVRLPGHQQNVAEWLAISDVYVLPSYREGLPRTVLEAMAMGLPVVATDVPGCREAVQHNKTGLLVPPRDVEALVKAIRRLLDDPELRRELGERGRQVAVEHFSTERVVNEYLALYAELLNGAEDR